MLFVLEAPAPLSSSHHSVRINVYNYSDMFSMHLSIHMSSSLVLRTAIWTQTAEFRFTMEKKKGKTTSTSSKLLQRIDPHIVFVLSFSLIFSFAEVTVLSRLRLDILHSLLIVPSSLHPYLEHLSPPLKIFFYRDIPTTRFYSFSSLFTHDFRWCIIDIKLSWNKQHIGVESETKQDD